MNIKQAVDEDVNDVICSAQSDDIIIFRHPNKMYLTFKSSGLQSKFFVKVSYLRELTNVSYMNKDRCSDQGANLGIEEEQQKEEVTPLDPRLPLV